MPQLLPCSDPDSVTRTQATTLLPTCGDVCRDPGEIACTRNRYFTGKFMTERDFKDEQWYFLNRGWLHQRALHGWGVVCGLEVIPHTQEACAQLGWVIIKPGMAIDCYGRTIVLREATPVNVADLKPGNPPDPLGPPPPSDKPFLLGIRYGELAVEPVPLLYDENGCGDRTAYNRIQETAALCWMDYDPEADCWQVPQPYTQCHPCHETRQCLKPCCPCGATVPLALITPPPNNPSSRPITEGQLTFDGVRYVPSPLSPRNLTHICDVNWNHDRDTPITQLEHKPDPEGPRPAQADQGEVEDSSRERQQHPHPHKHLYFCVTFDRKLRLVPGHPDHAVGLGSHTFIVQYSEREHGSYIELPGKITVEKIEHEDCSLSRAVFVPDECDLKELIETARHRRLYVRVTLKCDFIQDHRSRAVDGNFLRGGFPTGDGIEGGTFESWFILTHPHHHPHGGQSS